MPESGVTAALIIMASERKTYVRILRIINSDMDAATIVPLPNVWHHKDSDFISQPMNFWKKMKKIGNLENYNI